MISYRKQKFLSFNTSINLLPASVYFPHKKQPLLEEATSNIETLDFFSVCVQCWNLKGFFYRNMINIKREILKRKPNKSLNLSFAIHFPHPKSSPKAMDTFHSTWNTWKHCKFVQRNCWKVKWKTVREIEISDKNPLIFWYIF